MQGMLAAGRGSTGSSAVRALIVLAATVAALALPQAAQAAIPNVFGGQVDCEVQGDGVRFCSNFGADPRSTVPTFDGVPIDVDAAFPPEPATGPDGDYPLVMLFHGYGGSKMGLDAMDRWLDRGYATFSMTDRGFHESCGSEASRDAAPGACADGFVRLMDTRYEVRDAQLFAGLLADEGLIDPQRIGATGGSYGGGMSMALAALRDRTMMPDGSLVPWTSPDGQQLQIAAATPNVPWTDLAYSLVPNGSTLDFRVNNPYRGRFGVMKESLVNGLYFSGQGAPGFYAPVGTPGADLTGWRDLLLAGEPYDGDPRAQAMLDEITTYHSSYYIDHSQPPAPLLISNGFTDDLFPADEALRFYNRTRAEYPGADISLFFGDFGHPRAQNKADVISVLERRETAWIDHYVKGVGPEPAQDVAAMTETCPSSAPSGGPFAADSWDALSHGEIRFSDPQTKTIAPDAGSPEVAAKFNPVGGSACATADGADQPGTASYRLDAAPPGGYTLLGSPTVTAEFTLPGDTSQVAARLLDVGPDGQETLVARGLWRPATGGPTEQIFQLHPNGWKFAEGHVPKLELLPADTNPGLIGGYGRRSNDQQPVIVSNLSLVLPLADKPGGAVQVPAPIAAPGPVAPRADARAKLTKGKLKVKGRKLKVRVRCPKDFEACTDGKLKLRTAGKARGVKHARGRFKVAKGGFKHLDGGEKRGMKLKLTHKARRYFGEHHRLAVRSQVSTAETPTPAKQRKNAVASKRRR
ncbi:MAG: prolyl oligopeptidase family serine peptidase [Solirubrobacterales bacterium]|nr:prolyl oligopeptidase family serine peptidase [Solirubrobacterales bacterium]